MHAESCASFRDMQSIENDLRTCLKLLEESVQCVAGCECWMSYEGRSWDDEDKLRSAVARLGPARASEVVAAIENLGRLSDADAEIWAPRLSEWLHGATAPPVVPYDPRTFFARALGRLRRFVDVRARK